MNIIYDNTMMNDTQNIYRGGFEVISNSENESNEITGGGKKRFHNKAVPFGLALKRIKPQLNYECKNGDVLDNTLFEKLFNSIARVNSSEKKEKKNATRRKK